MAEVVVGRATPGTTTRTGYDVDEHAFGPGQGLWLGGVEIPGAPRLHGHFDGDAALHAVAGALLGAAGLGDLGELVPADERTARGAASSAFVREAVKRLAAAGWQSASLDLTIRAGRPHLASFALAMRAAIAALLDIDAAAVNVKLSTGNLSGDAGAGRTIEARAVVTVRAVGDAG
jgi:2-C-methyl-D-erythritol 2,4-cyclodiphosphate synthase